MLFVNVEYSLLELALCVSPQLLLSSELDQFFPKIRFNVGFDLGGLLSRDQPIPYRCGHQSLSNFASFFQA
jgi:hypothetical protein